MRWEEQQQGELERHRRDQRKEHREKRRDVGKETGRQGTLPERLVRAYFEEADPLTETLLMSWVSFGATFGITRFITHGIRGKWLPVKNVSAGDKHLHHYNFGILLLAGVGFMAVRLPRHAGHRPVAGIAYGMGTALIADEAALLLNLEDVYWKEKGRVSINIVTGIIALLGAYVVGEPFFDDAIREIRRGVRRIG